MNPITSTTSSPSKRLIFIDALRAYAIMMMLQGHFIDTLLAEQYRNPDSWLFSTWSFMRGMTAPIFFTVSGIVFVFLLLKDGRPLAENVRVQKGIRRGLMLLFLGYALKWNLFALLAFRWYPSFIALDVLQNIGMAILALIGLYALSQKLKWSYPLMLGAGGVTIFLLYPKSQQIDWSFLPVFFENYFSKVNGSIFLPIPWIGYTLLGGLIGWHVHNRTNWYFKPWPGIALLILGYWMDKSSTNALHNLYELTGLPNFLQLANNNWLFWRLGHVFIVIGIFILLTQILHRYIPKLFLTIGSETLTIYSVHYVLLYGTWLGLGISPIVGYRSLGPWAAAFGALSFILFFIFLVSQLEPIRAWLDAEKAAFSAKAYRWYRIARVKTIRYYFAQKQQMAWLKFRKASERA